MSHISGNGYALRVTSQTYSTQKKIHNQNTFSIPCSIDYFRFGPGIGWYRYQVIGNRPPLPTAKFQVIAGFLILDFNLNMKGKQQV
jgi:hypothetical protein